MRYVDLRDRDISDAAASAFVNNSNARNVLKSFVDLSGKDGFKLKDLNEGLTEFGLRVILDKTNEVKGKTGQKYVIDVIKKIELKEAKESLKESK